MKLSDDMIQVCEIQGDIFKNAQRDFKCGGKIFIYHFMYSRLAKKLDNPRYMLSYDPSNHKEQLLEEYPSLNNPGGEIVDEYIMHWIGYIYRATSYIKEISSKLLFKYMNPDELIKMYNVYHTFGIDYCVERLSEHFELDKKNTLDERTLIREIYSDLLIELKKLNEI